MADKPEPATLEMHIPSDLSGLRLDQALARMFPEYSRSRLAAWTREGLVTVDGEIRRPRDPVEEGASVRVVPQQALAVTSEPESMPLEVAYEDAALLIVNKPAGLVVHPGAGTTTSTSNRPRAAPP